MSFFVADRLSAGYGKNRIISNVSFQLEAGCLMGVIGANGTGKTTLLKALCGILPHEGTCTLERIILEKQNARKIAQLCSYIPQRSGISIDISALDVVLMGFNPRLGLLEHPTAEMQEEAMQALSRVGLAGMAHTNYLHLSEGQKQLCILARTLVSPSRLLLLDEPESALDFRYRDEMLSMLRQWVCAGRRSAIVTLHDPSLALNCCDQLLLMSGGQVLTILHPGQDPIDHMEQMLSRIYGPVSLHCCRNHKGVSSLLMLREDER